MISRTPVLLATLGALTLAGCVNNQPFGPTTENNQRTQAGIATGALVGAALGATRERGSTLGNVAAGATVGALLGGAIGNSLDAQAAELRRTMDSRVSVTNTGSELIVNLPQDILFAVDSATLRGDLTQDLADVAQSLLNYPNTTVQVIGHTDNTGSAAYNQDLSQRRAAAVASVLRNNGVPGGRLVAFGRGEDQPIASNLTTAGKAQNRRVEIIIRPN